MDKTESPLPSAPPSPATATRDEINEFVCALIHELRNRLNGIALEASDLAEQAGPSADASGLQRQVQECSRFLKSTRELVAPEAPQHVVPTLAELTQKLRRQEI